MQSSDHQLPQRTRLRHDTPHWVGADAWFFLTINCAALASAQHYHDLGKWHVGLLLLMPDHLHGIFSFPHTSKPMAALIADWKRFNARSLGIRWQEGFFDHRLRSDEEVSAKVRYIQHNPIVKGLCETPEMWPHQICPLWPDTQDAAEVYWVDR